MPFRCVLLHRCPVLLQASALMAFVPVQNNTVVHGCCRTASGEHKIALFNPTSDCMLFNLQPKRHCLRSPVLINSNIQIIQHANLNTSMRQNTAYALCFSVLSPLSTKVLPCSSIFSHMFISAAFLYLQAGPEVDGADHLQNRRGCEPGQNRHGWVLYVDFHD